MKTNVWFKLNVIDKLFRQENGEKGNMLVHPQKVSFLRKAEEQKFGEEIDDGAFSVFCESSETKKKASSFLHSA